MHFERASAQLTFVCLHVTMPWKPGCYELLTSFTTCPHIIAFLCIDLLSCLFQSRHIPSGTAHTSHFELKCLKSVQGCAKSATPDSASTTISIAKGGSERICVFFCENGYQLVKSGSANHKLRTSMSFEYVLLWSSCCGFFNVHIIS